MPSNSLPALHGWLWVVHGISLFRAYTALWLLWLFCCWISLLMAATVPLLGPLLVFTLIPGIGAGLMVACEAVQHGQPPSPRHLLEPFRANRKGQLQLGLIYAACLAIGLGLSALADGGVFLRQILIGPKQSEIAPGLPELSPAVLIFLFFYFAAALGIWSAPPLVHWRGMSPPKALFFSFFAWLRNWRAFAVYALGWLFFAMVVPFLIAMVLFSTILPHDLGGATLASFILVPYLSAVAGSMICSFYSSYIAIFGENPAIG
jgi:hypothetical protein